MWRDIVWSWESYHREVVSQTSTRQFFQRDTENSQRDLGCPWELHTIWIRVKDVVQLQRE